MLGLSDGIETMGHIQWPVALCLLLSWSLTFLALSKGVKSVGKVLSVFLFGRLAGISNIFYLVPGV